MLRRISRMCSMSMIWMVVTAGSSPAVAATLVVGPGQTYESITAGMNAAMDGDTLLIHDGVYKEQLVVNKALTFEAVNVGGAILDGGGGLVLVDVKQNATFFGIHFRNAHWGVRIRNAGAAHYTCLRCIASGFAAAFMLDNSSGRSGTADIINCVIVDSGEALNINDGGTLRVINTIIANVTFAYVAYDAVAILPDYNLLHNVETVAGGPHAGSIAVDSAQIVADPQFVDPDNANFRVLPGSPAIDTGKDVGPPFLGSAPDRGAFEFNPAAKGHPTAGLFHCVRYEDLRNIHPCAVTKIVSIKDPCWKPDPCSCECQVAPCVLVKICVPPYGCPKVRVTRNGSKVKYDYGKYEVEITSRNGVVKVDYDD